MRRTEVLHGGIRADLISKVNAVEVKVENCTSAIKDELETQVGDVC